MPTIADRVFRDFERYTGDGKPNEPTGHGLPVGDPSSGVCNPSKREIRNWANSMEAAAGAAAGVAPYPSFAAAVNTGVAPYIIVDGQMYEADGNGPFYSADGRRWKPSTPKSDGGRPILVVAMGQSNMLGAAAETNGDRRTLNGQVYVYEHIPGPGQTTGWKCAGPDSPDWPWSPTGNNLAYHFCDALQKQSGRPVYLVMHAAGGQPIAEWLPSGGGVSGATGHMFSATNSAFQAAIIAPIPTGGTLTSRGLVRADYLLWHQGEADADYRGTTGAQWLARFRTVINVLRTGQGTSADPMIQGGAPVLVGELLRGGVSPGGQPTDDRNKEIAVLNMTEPLVTSVSSRNLGSGDGLHFTGTSLQEFGRRYFERLGQFPKLVPEEVSPNHTRISGRVVTLRGDGLQVNAGQSVTVTLPISMSDNRFVPNISITAHGASTPYPPLLGARTVDSFIVRNTGGSNMTVAWTITDTAAM